MGKGTNVAILLIVASILCNCNLLEARTLPPWMPWFTYTSTVDDLDQYLKDNVPIGQRNVFLLAQSVTISSDIMLKSNYHAQQLPFELTIVCDKLEVYVSWTRYVSWTTYVTGNVYYTVDLSGDNAPDYVSSAPNVAPPSNYSPLNGKIGANGGSIYLYAKQKTGLGKLMVYANGGNGGKGQDGSNGNPGIDATWSTGGTNGQDGGDGARGGAGGDAGEILVNSMTDPETILHPISFGGSGGQGGTGGKGGKGGDAYSSTTHVTYNGRSLSTTRYIAGGDPGSDGANGRSGYAGHTIFNHEHEKNQMTSEEDFYRSLPITGTHLQRALNAEMYRMMHARYQQSNRNNVFYKIRQAITWISKLAEANGYDIVQHRCTKMLELCSRLENEQTLASSSIRVKKSAIKEHFDKIRQVAEQSVNKEPSQLNEMIQNSALLMEYSHYARGFNNIYRRHENLKDRYYDSKAIADLLGGITSPSTVIVNFLTQAFAPKLVDKILSIARSKPYLNDVLSRLFSIADTSTIDAAEVFEGLAIGAEAAPLLGVLGAERIIEPEIESVTVKTVAGKVIDDLHKDWGIYFVEVEDAIAKYERLIRSRIQRTTQNGRNTVRVRKDGNLKKINRPTTRGPYLVPERQNREPPSEEPPPPNRRRPPPPPIELTGKFLGVLDKYDVVESDTDQAVVSFDAIKLFFTVTSEGSLNLNSLDTYQQEELYAQLEAYSLPFSELPSFIITTTIDKTLINENAVGNWFQFDCSFSLSGSDDEVIISSTIVAIIENRLSQMLSLDVDNDVPVTVSSIKPLTTTLQTEVVSRLGLSSVGAQQTGRKKRQVSGGSSQTCSVSQNSNDNLKISIVEIADVGQGSCNLLYVTFTPNHVEIVYDLGYGKGKQTGSAEDTLVGKISDASTIVISHWDLDHYRYLVRNPTEILATGKSFVAPHFGSNTGPTVRRAVSSIPEEYLELVPVGRYTANSAPFFGRLGIAENVDLRTTTLLSGRVKNDVGALTLGILDNDCSPLLLLPGDASYSVIPNQQQYVRSSRFPYGSVASLKYMVATHHGSTRNIGTVPLAASNSGYLFYSYGPNNRYGHSASRARPFYKPRQWRYRYATERNPPGIYICLDLERQSGARLSLLPRPTDSCM